MDYLVIWLSQLYLIELILIVLKIYIKHHCFDINLIKIDLAIPELIQQLKKTWICFFIIDINYIWQLS